MRWGLTAIQRFILHGISSRGEGKQKHSFGKESLGGKRETQEKKKEFLFIYKKVARDMLPERIS
jgi:hypothetical protein